MNDYPTLHTIVKDARQETQTDRRESGFHRHRDWTMPRKLPALNYEQAFEEVCKVVDDHPELWHRPSREAVMFTVNALWKRTD